jgi:MSHA biogenesis protein MshJ
VNATLRTKWMSLLAQIDALNRRERLMVLAAALAVVGFAGDTFLLGPQRASLMQVERDAARERTELDRIEAQLAELNGRLASDPDEVPRLRLKQLTAELSELNAGFQRLEQSLVPPDQMSRLLEQVMRRTQGISVVRLQTLAPISLPEREADESRMPGQRDATAAAPTPAGEASGASGRKSAAAPAAAGPAAATAAAPAAATAAAPAPSRRCGATASS